MTAFTNDAAREIGPRKWWALAALALAAVAFSLDLTVLNLALPTLAIDLVATTGQLQWIVDGYALVLAALVLPAGLLGDRYGRKRFLLVALPLFGLASIGCAYATSADALIVARIALGIGGAFILPLALSMLPVFFDETDRPTALALLMGSVFLAYPLGPILGGWLLTHFWWGSVFLINVPIVALATAVVAITLPETKSARAPAIDYGGVVLSVMAIFGLTFGAIEAESASWSDPVVLAALAVGAVATGLLVLWERSVMRRGGEPLIELGLFRSAGFTWGTLLATLVTFAMFGLLFGLPQYLSAIGGHDALGAGYRLLPLVGGLLVGGGVIRRFGGRIQEKTLVALGFLIMAGGLVLGGTMAVDSGDGFIILWVAIVGLGLGLSLPSTVDAALAALTPDRSGVGAALVTAFRQVGGTLGVAILGTVLGSVYRVQLPLDIVPAAAANTVAGNVAGGIAVADQLGSADLRDAVQAAFVHAMDVMLWVCAGVAIAGVVLALLFLPYRQRAPQRS
jgi:DHA2 family multidrug resistance protein-like MFS transporter